MEIMKKFLIIILFYSLSSCSSSGGEIISPPINEEKENFQNYELEGFTVFISSSFTWDENSNNAYLFLGKVLDAFWKSVDAKRQEILIKHPIYIMNKDEDKVLEYVTSIDEIDETNIIVIYDIVEFYESSFTSLGAPFIEEFAKLYYDLYLTEEEKDKISSVWSNTIGLYDSNNVSDDAVSYFANLTTAYYSINKNSPVDYHSLMSFDKDGFLLMESLWGERSLKEYECIWIESFRVMYPIKFKDSESTISAIANLREDLKGIVDTVPEIFVDLFRRKILWLDNTTTDGAACYHDSIEWLIANGYIKEKSKCIEINNMANYVNWSNSNQPLMVLHEYAHMYHHSSYLESNMINAAYENAMNSGLYDNVEYFDGNGYSTRKAYATNNQFEYFSELTEAYFGKNDYYPFDREDLREHDPVGYEMIDKVWNINNFRE